MSSLEEQLASLRSSLEGGQTLPQTTGRVVTNEQDAAVAEGQALSGSGAVATGFANEFLGAFQGTSPVVNQITGKPNYEIVGQLQEADFGPIAVSSSGQWVDVDPEKHVILLDPNTGKPTVYARNPETDEDLMAAARLFALGGLTSPVTKIPSGVTNLRPSQVAINQLDQAGVSPTVPAVFQGRTSQTLTNTLREVPGSADIIQSGLTRSGTQAAASAERIAAATGTASTRLAGGEALIRGAERFVGNVQADISLSADRITEIIKTPVRDLVAAEGEGFLLKSNAMLQRVDGFFDGTETVRVDEAMNALAGSAQKFDLAELGEEFTSPRFQRWANLIRESGGTLSYNDLRLFRTEVGRLLRKPEILLGESLDSEALKKLYGALSDDLMEAAKEVGPDAVQAVQQADDFYREGAETIRTTLGKLLKLDASGEATFDLLLRRAGDKGSANIRELQALREAIPDDEWAEVASAVIRELGRPTAANVDRLADANFSVTSFMTNFNRLSDDGKQVLFGGREGLLDELDNLADVVTRLRQTERLMNVSGTARIGVYSTLGLMVGLEQFMTAGATVAGSAVAAKLMMSPRLVRWMANAPTTAIGSQAWVRHAAELNAIASQEPAIAPVANQLLLILQQEGLPNQAGPNLESQMDSLRNSLGGSGEAGTQ